MKAIILAAGLGQRLNELTSDRPKTLVKVANKELLLHVLNFIDHPSVNKRVIITGYKSDLIKNFIKERNLDIEIIFNPNFEQGSIRTIEAATELMNDDFLVLNSDHIYPKRMFKKLLSERKDITAMCDFDRTLGADDMKVKLNPKKNIEKINKTLSEYDCGYIGMTYCSKELASLYRKSISSTRKKHGDSAPVEWILGDLAEGGQKINICDLSGFGWFEVDNEEDLKFAERQLLKKGDMLK